MKNLVDLEKIINSELNTKINSSYINHEELRLTIDPEDISEVVLFLKNNPNTKFRQLIDITAVDYPNKKDRFLIIYQFLSVTNNQRVRVLGSISANDVIPSMSKLYFSALWAERELWDMFGIYVDGHPDLRRILTDYGFQGHPLRKDFPLTGFDEVSYETESRRVVYNKVKLTQDYRDFDFNSPWGAEDTIKNEKNND